MVNEPSQTGIKTDTNHLQNIFFYQNSCKIYQWIFTVHWMAFTGTTYRITWHKNNAGQLKSVSEGYHSMSLLNSDFCSMRELDALLIPVPSGWDASSSEIRNWHFARLSEQVISRIHGTFHYYWSAWTICYSIKKTIFHELLLSCIFLKIWL